MTFLQPVLSLPPAAEGTPALTTALEGAAKSSLLAEVNRQYRLSDAAWQDLGWAAAASTAPRGHAFRELPEPLQRVEEREEKQAILCLFTRQKQPQPQISMFSERKCRYFLFRQCKVQHIAVTP